MDPSANFFSGEIPTRPCDAHATKRIVFEIDSTAGDNGVGFNYALTETDVLPFYRQAVLNTTLRVMVYNGDTE